MSSPLAAAFSPRALGTHNDPREKWYEPKGNRFLLKEKRKEEREG